VFEAGGPLANLESALGHIYLLPIAAGAKPDATAERCVQWLNDLSVEDRRSVSGTERRDFMWAADELLFHSRTAKNGLIMVSLLAEAENEPYGNNATGVFCECFCPGHPQFPLPLDERAGILDQCCFLDRSKDLGYLGIKAIEEGLGTHGTVTLRQGRGSSPVDTQPVMSYAEVRAYREHLIDTLINMAGDPTHVTHEAACRALPGALRDYSAAAPPESTLPRVAAVLDLALVVKAPVSLAEIGNSLAFLRRVYAEHSGESIGSDAMAELEKQANRIDQGDFRSRLMKWAGEWPYFDLEDGHDGQIGFAIAHEAINTPEVLDEILRVWLCAEAQRGYQFFRLLGLKDAKRVWVCTMRELGARRETATAYMGYFSGLASTDPHYVEALLDEDSSTAQVDPRAIVSVTCSMAGGTKGVERIERLLLEKQVTEQTVAEICRGSLWLRSLPPAGFIRIVNAISGPGLGNAHQAFELVALGREDFAQETSDVREVAWHLLEAGHCDPHSEPYADILAEKIAVTDLDRAYRLLEMLIRKASLQDDWNPLAKHGHAGFWDTLHRRDPQRALRTVLEFVVRNPEHATGVIWHFPDVLEQETDSQILQEMAAQGPEWATVIASVISPAKPGLWPLAMCILRQYIHDPNVCKSLFSTVTSPYHATGFVTREQARETAKSVLESVVAELSRAPAAPEYRWLEKAREKLEDAYKGLAVDDDDWE
jgi:hypothetical protein